MKNLKVFIIIMSMLLLTGCSYEKKPVTATDKVGETAPEMNNETSASRLNLKWILSRIKDKDFKESSRPSFVIISDDFKSYSGNGGCNSLRGGMKVEGSKITFEPGMMTKMACRNLNQETLFVTTLIKATRYEILGEELFLYQNDQLLMVLEENKKSKV